MFDKYFLLMTRFLAKALIIHEHYLHRRNKSTSSLHTLTSYLRSSIMFHEFPYNLENLKTYCSLHQCIFGFLQDFFHILHVSFFFFNTKVIPKRTNFLSSQKSNMFLLHYYKHCDIWPIVHICPNCKIKKIIN